MSIYIFKRYETKYVLTREQYNSILPVISDKLIKEVYNTPFIQSLYYDTDDYLLIRRSIEKPVYKEKLRLRSYGLNDINKKSFFEIKKKYDGVVYKRRIKISEFNTKKFIEENYSLDSQIGKEIEYMKCLYKGIKPKMLLIYERDAYLGDDELRITFDTNVMYRTEDLSLASGLYGNKLIEEDLILMEVKTPTAIPLWLCKLLNENKIYKGSFSKYGEAYKKELKEKKIWK